MASVARFGALAAALLAAVAVAVVIGVDQLLDPYVDAAEADRVRFLVPWVAGGGAAVAWAILVVAHARVTGTLRERARGLTLAVAEHERVYDLTLEALSKALDVRDTPASGNSTRVVEYMEIIAKELALPEEELANLRRGALLHDIGKVGVPDHILRKPASLSEQEWMVVMRHPELGAKLIGGITFLQSVATIVRHHHERWDGTGYPDRLKAEQIPVGARIFAVADAFDAMTSDRPYRRAKSLSDARREIERNRGTQFDPRVVDAFLRVPVSTLAQIAETAPRSPRVDAASG